MNCVLMAFSFVSSQQQMKKFPVIVLPKEKLVDTNGAGIFFHLGQHTIVVIEKQCIVFDTSMSKNMSDMILALGQIPKLSFYLHDVIVL